MKISIIIPTYNEESTIERLMETLEPLNERCEILFVDGGSTDGTLALLKDRYPVIQSPKGRAKQMNMGAEESSGDVLFFLHCDSEVPPTALEEIETVMKKYRAGCFGIAFHSYNFFMFTCRVISNHRIKDRKVMFGDQGIFIDRKLFFEVGKAAERGDGATIFGYYVDDPERFGIVEFDEKGKAVSIEEKPEHPKSNYCVTGLYFYDNRVSDYAGQLKPSRRGELEITDLNRIYLEQGRLRVELLGQGFTWLDAGTHESLTDATNFVKTVETHQHRKIGCLEEIAYMNGWISRNALLEVCEKYRQNQYGQYLHDVAEGKFRENLF